MLNNQYVRNIFFAVDDIPHNPLVHVFLYVTLAFGIAFVFFADPTGASSTFLYKLTVANIHGNATSLWGVGCILATLLNTFAFAFRKKFIGVTACWLGIFVWGFSLWIYILGGFYFGALVASLPNLVFWSWGYLQVRKYYRNYHQGHRPIKRIKS